MISTGAMMPQEREAQGHARPPMVRRLAWRALMALYPLTWCTWWAVERIYSLTHPPYLDLGAPYNLLRVRARSYDGPAVRLADGAVVRPGDRILNLHINSPVARELWRRKTDPYRAGTEDLRCVARFLVGHPDYVAVRGRNKLRHMMESLGAEVHDVPGVLPKLEQLFEEMAILIFHPRRLQRLERHYAEIADSWFSRSTFLALFPPGQDGDG